MKPDLEEVLWGQVNIFHRATARIERSLDENEQEQRRLQREQDGSEVKSTELERLTAEARGVTQVAFKPDWTKHAEALPRRTPPPGTPSRRGATGAR